MAGGRWDEASGTRSSSPPPLPRLLASAPTLWSRRRAGCQAVETVHGCVRRLSSEDAQHAFFRLTPASLQTFEAILGNEGYWCCATWGPADLEYRKFFYARPPRLAGLCVWGGGARGAGGGASERCRKV